MAKMGFEGRVVHFDWHNERPRGFGYQFKSKAEYRWACYLDLLKKSGELLAWGYETHKFEFRERHRKKGVYTPDFFLKYNYDQNKKDYEVKTEYHEVKTSLRQKDVYRFKQFRLDYPYERIILVLSSMPKKSVKQLRLLENARKYVDDVIIAGPILRKLGL